MRMPQPLLTGDRAYVVRSLAETDLELAAAPARASRSILDVGSGRDRRQGVPPVTGGEAVIADALIAGPALDWSVQHRLAQAWKRL
jgi:hypothetical protein